MAKQTPEEKRAKNAARMRKWRAEHKHITQTPEWRAKTYARVKKWQEKKRAERDGVR